jgi:glutaredoxin-related protein
MEWLMAVKIFGNPTCPDCMKLQATLMANPGKLDIEPNDIRDLGALKSFLKLRDTDSAFTEIREKGGIGIPCIVDETGKVTLDWRSFVSSRGLNVVEDISGIPATGVACSLKDRNC